MNEAQLKAVVRHTFTLRDTADRAVLDTDALLARVMRQARLLVETLPEESLMLPKAWRTLSGLVTKELQVYTDALDRAIKREEVANREEMMAYAVREARYAGAKQEKEAPLLLPAEVMAMTDKTVLGSNTYGQVFRGGKDGISGWTKNSFRIVDKTVQQGILEGLSVAEIGRRIAQTRERRGITEVSLDGDTAARRIRGQSLATSRTASFDVADQIKKRYQPLLFPDIRGDGFGYEWFAQLDSATCQTCASLSGRRSNDGVTFINGGRVPHIPVHINCRCTFMLTGPAVLPIKGKSQSAKTKQETTVEEDFSDFLANSDNATQVDFFGGGPIGERRARYFRKQLRKPNRSPQQVLQNMLTGPAGAKRFIKVP